MVKKITFDFSPTSIQRARLRLVQYKSFLNKIEEEILIAMLDYGQRYAQEEISNLGATYTGELANSIEIELLGKVGYIYTELDYAKFVEYGTGIVGAMESNRHPKLPASWIHDASGHGMEGWIYYNENDGRFHRTLGMKHRPFMYNTAKALEKNKSQIVKGVLKK